VLWFTLLGMVVIGGAVLLRRLERRRVAAAWAANTTEHPFIELPVPPRDWTSYWRLPPEDPPGALPVRLPSSALPAIDAAMTAPRATMETTATRDLAIAQVALLERCPGCGRPTTGANSRADEQGRRWHLDCRAG
jgi:hypothetical protein